MISGAIVLYNTPRQKVDKAIKSYAPDNGRILFLIDNSKYRTDEYEGVPNIIYIHNKKNIGYGAANNIGIRMAIERKSRYHTIMNPDVYYDPSVIDDLVTYADQNEDIIEIMPRILSPDGEEQYLAKLLPTPKDVFCRRFLSKTKIAKEIDEKYTLKNVDHSKVINAPFLSGCFMFLRVDALSSNELFFDERFFMYFEDCDFCRRVHRIGRTSYYPNVSIVHVHERESYRNPKMLIIHIVSTIKYFCKYGWLIDAERERVNKKTIDYESR